MENGVSSIWGNGSGLSSGCEAEINKEKDNSIRSGVEAEEAATPQSRAFACEETTGCRLPGRVPQERPLELRGLLSLAGADTILLSIQSQGVGA